MDDLISRQAAIDAIYGITMCGWQIPLESAIFNIKKLPPAQRKKGKWIKDAEAFYRAVNQKGGGVNEDTPFFTEGCAACSECLAVFNVIENYTGIFNFCPNCGAPMRK